MLKLKAQLWCDVCGVYPPKSQQAGSDIIRWVWLSTDGSGTLLLPEGWERGGYGMWTSEKAYCSSVCKAREVEAEELSKVKEGQHLWEAHTNLLHCTHCGTTCSRYAGRHTPRFVMPPGWSNQSSYLLCEICANNPDILKKWQRVGSELYDP